jgi:protein-S-isoprenylcysteine O-methyltransferase Ste14
VALTPDEVRLAAFAMAAAYGAMVFGAFIPSSRRHTREAAAPRAARSVSTIVDRLWVATQGAIIAALFAGLFFPQFLLWLPTNLLSFSSALVAASGVVLFVAGSGLLAWAARHLGAELTVEIETREGGRLVTNGPYARVRHPIYTGVFLLIGGAAIAFASPALAAYTPLSIYCARVRALAEEDLLSSDPVHGAAYQAYLARTGRFLPGRRRRPPPDGSPGLVSASSRP